MSTEPTLAVTIPPEQFMKVKFAVTAALFAAAASSNLSAQSGVNSGGGSWQSGWTPGTQVNEFWNRASDDGPTCNVGYFVQGGFGPCSNQNPVAFPAPMGWSNATYLAMGIPLANLAPSFTMKAGYYNLSFLGQVAGASPARQVGLRYTDGTVIHSFGAAPESYQFAADRDWEFTLQSWLPIGAGTFGSGDLFNRQFAIFANSNGANGDNHGEWLVGAEDNSCGEINEICSGLSDYDYNDALIHVSAVPEPSTYALMTAGLLVIGGAMRRRRQSAPIA